MIELNKENVAEALLAAVKKRGADYRYQSEFGKLCLYVVGKEPERKPGCIVGEVLHSSFGVPLDTLDRFPDMIIPGVLNSLAQEGVLTFTGAAKNMLWAAQMAQDYGSTWGTALDKALDYSSVA